MGYPRVAFLAGAIAAAAAGLGTAGVVHAAPAIQLAPANSTSSGQAGYAVSKTPATASASANWVVPALTCTAATRAMAPGSMIFDTSGAPSGTLVESYCQGGKAHYQAIFVVAGSITASSVAVAAGNTVSTSITQSKSGTTLAISDATTKKSQTAKAGGEATASALLGVETLFNTSSGATYPIPTFKTIPFTAGQLDGLTVAAAKATAYNLEIHSPTVNIATGPLNAAGKGFTETFKHN